MGRSVILTDVLTTLFGIIISTLLGLVAWFIKVQFANIEKRLSSIEDNLNGPAKITNDWKNTLIDSLSHDSRLLKLIMDYRSSGNPYDYNRKEELMEKYKNKTLTHEEAEELRRILEEDEKKAMEKKDALALLAIMVVLFALEGLASKK